MIIRIKEVGNGNADKKYMFIREIKTYLLNRGNAKRSRRDSRPLVEDDEEGHLIYSRGDIIQGRLVIVHFLY